MRIMMRAGRCLVCAVLFAAGLAVAPASAQELSEKAARAFMEYAWSLTPEKFTKPNGETVQIDKTKRDEVMIPLDVARDVIRAGRLSAHAQVCELAQEQVDNHNSLMRRQVQSKKWTPQQIVYINQLHLTVVMLLTGRISWSRRVTRAIRPTTSRSWSRRSRSRPRPAPLSRSRR
jgi:hypothetical protein